jgi:glycosyltransferase involved in cell wall biosynthesis
MDTKRDGHNHCNRANEDVFFAAGYLEMYFDVAESGISPWDHYLRYGQKEGRDNGNHPDENVFFAEGYLEIYPDVAESGQDPWHHYVLHGKEEGRDNGNHPGDDLFFAAGYLEMYPDIAQAKLDPWRHYVLNGKKEGRDNGNHPADDVFFAAGYLEMYSDIARAKLDPWRHYVLNGKKEGRDNGNHPADDVFFAAGYLEMYPDIAQAKLDPWRHYVLNGKKEGRLNCSIKNLQLYEGINVDNVKQNILIVSSDALRTGAPILTLNIIKSLNQTYNVYTLCLGEGDLVDDFVRSSSFTVVIDAKYRLNSSCLRKYFDNNFKKCKFSFAIVNSAIASAFLKISFENDIPSILLVHEFSYSFSYYGCSSPVDIYRNFVFADDIIFSSEIVRKSYSSQFGSLPYSTAIIPQGDPKILGDDSAMDQKEEVWVNLIKEQSKKHKLIVGLGTRQFRKGVDLFLITAGEILKKTEDAFFVWIGASCGETFLQSVLDFGIDALNLRNNFVFIPSLKRLNEVFPFFDLVLLTSRFDPLPNVIIGAMRNGIPFVTFDEVSGICEILINNDLGSYCLAKYLDCYGLADKACGLLKDKKLYEKVSKDLLNIYSREFSFNLYIKKLLDEAMIAKTNHAALLDKAHLIVNKNLLYLNTSSISCAKAGLQYVLNCELKPYPGFLPIVDTELRSIKNFNFIEEQKCNYESIDGSLMSYDHVSSSVAIHIHAYYLDELTDIIARLQLNSCFRDIFYLVSTTKDNLESVKALFSENKLKCLVRVSDNKGRDYGPFFTLFNDYISSFEIIGHIHTKKSLVVNDRQAIELWKDSMLSSLLGYSDKTQTVNMLDRNLTYLEEHSDIGMLFPDDPYVCGWNLNRPAAENLLGRLGVKIPNLTSFNQFNFPVGSMFLSRYLAIKDFFVLTNDDFPPEPVPYDGTILHAIERVLPFVSKANNFENVCVFNKSHSRISNNG